MAQIMNFKRMEVTGATKDEALANAPFGIMGDATQAWRIAHKNHVGAWTDADTKAFMLAYLEKKSKNVAGAGFYITVNPAVVDSRERPYKTIDVKNELGARKTSRVFQLIDDATGMVLAETPVTRVNKVDKDGNVVTDEDGKVVKVWKTSTKAQAKELGRSLYTEKGFKGNLTAKIVEKVVEGEAVAFKMQYTPSAGSHPGTYLIFGIENA